MNNVIDLWIQKEFKSIPQSIVESLYPNFEGLEVLTPATTKFECNNCSEEFSQEEVDDIEEDSNGEKLCPTCLIEDEDSYAVIEEIEDMDEIPYDSPCSKIYMKPLSISEWILDNLKEVSNCGFQIYKCDELGILLGIDEVEYDHQEAHWISLYEIVK